MQTSGTCRHQTQTDGLVHEVDTVNRELTAVVGGELLTFDVPPNCVVVLRGERVKLRLVQPGDFARLTYAEVRGSRVARVVEVQDGPLPAGRSR
jgi:hypothetical protein